MPSVAAPEFTPPAYCSVPPRSASAGAEARELAAASGLILDPWQAWAVDQILGERPDGGAAAFEAAVIVSRQNGKGAILEALALAWLFLSEEELILWSAHEFKTAAEAFRRMRILLQGAPDLWSLVGRITTANGDEAIELTTGQRLKFVARSKASARGFTGDKIILDEAYDLDADALAAMVPTLATRPDPQVIYTSSAGMADSDVLRSVRDRGRAGGDPSLCYLEWCAPDDADPDDPEAWRAANPGLGVRISEKFVANERRLMAASPEKFGRERLGWWDHPGAGAPPISTADWDACADPDSQIVGPIVLSVAVSMGGESASIGVAGHRADGLPHGELIENVLGTEWVIGRLKTLMDTWELRTIKRGDVRRPAVLLDPSGPAGSLLTALQKAGVEPVLINGVMKGQSCGELQVAVRTGTVRLLTAPDDPLHVALKAAVKRDVGDGAWAWGRKASGADITPLEAVTEALWGLSVAEATPAQPFFASRR